MIFQCLELSRGSTAGFTSTNTGVQPIPNVSKYLPVRVWNLTRQLQFLKGDLSFSTVTANW